MPIRLRRQTFDFLVDIGTAYSAISPALASVFHLTAPQGTITIAPAYGTPVNVPRVILPAMRDGLHGTPQRKKKPEFFPLVLICPTCGQNVDQPYLWIISKSWSLLEKQEPLKLG
jgi:hypothetical protein